MDFHSRPVEGDSKGRGFSCLLRRTPSPLRLSDVGSGFIGGLTDLSRPLCRNFPVTGAKATIVAHRRVYQDDDLPSPCIRTSRHVGDPPERMRANPRQGRENGATELSRAVVNKCTKLSSQGSTQREKSKRHMKDCAANHALVPFTLTMSFGIQQYKKVEPRPASDEVREEHGNFYIELLKLLGSKSMTPPILV